MSERDELLNELLTEFEEYIQNHEDSDYLDLTELQITIPQIEWFFDKVDNLNIFPEKKMCITCKHYDFEEESEQICNNENNLQLNDDNPLQEKRWYKMMVTPDFGCNEWSKLDE